MKNEVHLKVFVKQVNPHGLHLMNGEMSVADKRSAKKRAKIVDGKC